MSYTLPPGYYLYADARCPKCGGRVVEVDRVEGLPIHACPAGCSAVVVPPRSPDVRPLPSEAADALADEVYRNWLGGD